MTAPLAGASFRDSVVIVTGASSGIGREIALGLARQGAHLALAARRPAPLQHIAEEARAEGGAAVAVPTDVTDPAQCETLVARTVERFGRLDTLVNNAGISMAFLFEELQDLTLPERIMRVNYLGSLYCTHYALPHLAAARGRLVGVASLTAKTGVPMRSLYAASKHAMAGFFDSLRIELEDRGVTVTVVYPDFVQTELRDRVMGPAGEPVGIHPAKRGEFMSAAECARIVVAAAAKRKREVIIGARGKLGLLIKAFAPRLVDRIAKRAIDRVRIGR